MKSEKKNLAKKIVNLLLNVLIFIFGIILLVSIYTGVQTRVLGNNYANFFGYSIFEVQTGSMADTINAGDCIIVRLTKKVKLNDIITYALDGEYITHRIIEVYSNKYVTKGDANNAKDDPINQNQIVGKVVNILPNFGIIRKTLFNPSVLIALIITLFLFNLAFKKNKPGDIKTKSNKEAILDNLIKKVSVPYKKIKNFINDKLSKKTEKKNAYKTESKNLENNKKSTSELKTSIPTKAEVENYYKDEDELDKTSFFRVIPVDANEVDDKFKKVPTKAEVENYYKDEDELDKTSLYRIIPVDASEVDNTLLEIADNEIKDDNKNDKSKEKEVKVEQPQEENKTEEDSTSAKIDLDLLKSKKGKNILDTAVLIKKEELNEIINILVETDKSRVRESTTKETFTNVYVDAKYYNYYGENSTKYSGKGLISQLESVIKETTTKLISDSSNDIKYKDTVTLYSNTFMLIVNLEKAKDSITDSKVKDEFYKKEISKYFKTLSNDRISQAIDKIVGIQRRYIDILESFMKKLETNMFSLNLNQLVTKKDMYGLELQHNISFSKVYSDYIIDKTYTEGIIAEDKMSVLLTLLSTQLIKDMTSSDFNKKYILYMPKSLYNKEKKLEKLLKMIDDKYAKENVIILITLEGLLNNKDFITKIRKQDYRFALTFDKVTMVEEKDRGDLYIVDYIFVSRKIANSIKVLSFIPEDLKENIVYEDIINKVGDFGGE